MREIRSTNPQSKSIKAKRHVAQVHAPRETERQLNFFPGGVVGGPTEQPCEAPLTRGPEHEHDEAKAAAVQKCGLVTRRRHLGSLGPSTGSSLIFRGLCAGFIFRGFCAWLRRQKPRAVV